MQTAMKKVTGPILLGILLVLPGCFSLSRSAPPQRHYVLGGGERVETAAAAGESEGFVIGVRQPRLAEYLATPFIVVRGGTHRVGFSDLDRWGEDLAGGLGRAVAGHMIATAPRKRVMVAPWATGTQPDYVIQLDFLRFEGVAPEDPGATRGEAHLLATWEILRGSDGVLLARGVTEVRDPDWTMGDFDGLVSLLDEGLGTLAEDLLLSVDRIAGP